MGHIYAQATTDIVADRGDTLDGEHDVLGDCDVIHGRVALDRVQSVGLVDTNSVSVSLGELRGVESGVEVVGIRGAVVAVDQFEGIRAKATAGWTRSVRRVEQSASVSGIERSDTSKVRKK